MTVAGCISVEVQSLGFRPVLSFASAVRSSGILLLNQRLLPSGYYFFIVILSRINNHMVYRCLLEQITHGKSDFLNGDKR